MNPFDVIALNFSLLLSTTMTTDQLTLGRFDRNELETYEEVSKEGSDFDVFANLSFRFGCDGRPAGFYADVDHGCRIFHVCDGADGGFPVICSNGTVFDQKRRICTDEDDTDCGRAHEWYHLNLFAHSTGMTEYEPTMTEDEAVPSVVPLLIV